MNGAAAQQAVIGVSIVWLLFVVGLAIYVTIKHSAAPKRVKPLDKPVEPGRQFPKAYYDRVCETHKASSFRVRKFATMVDVKDCDVCKKG